MLRLTGDNYQSYEAGQHIGIWRGLTDASANVQAARAHYESQFIALRDALKKALPADHELQATVDGLPGLVVGFDQMVKAFGEKASEHHRAGNESMGLLALSKLDRRAWWRSRRFLAWLGYVAAVSIGATLAALAAVYAIRQGW